MEKESKFVKNIKKLEKDGYAVDGAIVLFTSDKGSSGMAVEGNYSSNAVIVLRANEHILYELALAKARQKIFIESETKSPLGTSKSQTPSYTN